MAVPAAIYGVGGTPLGYRLLSSGPAPHYPGSPLGHCGAFGQAKDPISVVERGRISSMLRELSEGREDEICAMWPDAENEEVFAAVAPSLGFGPWDIQTDDDMAAFYESLEFAAGGYLEEIDAWRVEIGCPAPKRGNGNGNGNGMYWVALGAAGLAGLGITMWLLSR